MPHLRNLYKLADPEIRAKNWCALRFAARGRYWDIVRPLSPDPIFVIGCSRSGTTVTFETLSAAPELRSLGVEIPEFWNGLWGPKLNGWESEAAGAEHAQPRHRAAAQRYYFQRLGAGQVVDKTCINVMRVTYLAKLFPDARFVYIHRDGRDNISSMIDGWRHDGHFRLSQFLGPFPEKVAIEDGEFGEWSFFLPPGWRAYNHARLEEVCAYQWIMANRLALDASRHVAGGRWVRLRYEDIFERPVEMFASTFEKLGIPFTAALRFRCANLAPTSIVKGAPRRQKWKDHNPALIERILPTIHPMLRELGYDVD